MSYNDVADMAESGALTRRLYAAAAGEGINPPQPWVTDNIWALVSQPGWPAAWASAKALGVQNPGADEGVITDGMMLSAVQYLNQP